MNRILLVDDDLELCRMLAEYLGLEGFDVVTCAAMRCGPGWRGIRRTW